MIYVVEDNESIRETIKAYLELAGLTVQEFPGITGVLESLEYKNPELCILDVMLPDGNGFSLAKKIRETNSDIPFIFLTARESESDRITGLELGAEDYILKPFSTRELVLRVQNILKRTDRGNSTNARNGIHEWAAGNHLLRIDEVSHEASLDGQSVHLTTVEWNILVHLAENAGIVISRERILGECLDYGHDGSERTVNTHLKNLRAKLGEGLWIETIRGFGYKFTGKNK